MAKSAKKTTNVPARASKGTAVGQASDLLAMMGEDAGRGVSTAMEDNIVPLVYILQSNSPQLDRADKTKYLGKNAKAGDIWLRGTSEFFDGEEDGIPVVPCHFSKSWIEWRPDRGGFVARHRERPKDAVQKEEKVEGKPGDTRLVWRMPSGNSVVETREHVVLMLADGQKPRPFVIPMKSTDHTASREWMGLMNGVTVPNTDKTAPSYAYKYVMRTVPKKNDKGSWYGWRISHAGEEDGAAVPEMLDDLEIYKMARKISHDFESGALRADAPEAEADENESADM